MISVLCRTVFLIGLLAGIALPSEGQFHFHPAFKKANPTYVQVLKDFEKLPALKGASWGILIRNAGNGQNLAERNAGLQLIPASNMKLMTSLSGLAQLGPEYRFQTKVFTDGPLENGVLSGNLLIEGSGDPSIYSPDKEKFSNNFFQKLIAQLNEKGVEKIEGEIILLPSDNPYQGIQKDWSWSDIGNYYGAGIYPININENQFNVYLSAEKEGQKARLKRKDSLMDVKLDRVELETEKPGSPDLAYFYWIPGKREAQLIGSLPQESKEQRVKGAMQNPASVFVSVLKGELEKAKITLGNNQVKGNQKNLLYGHESVPLSRLVQEVNLNSNNLFTESIAFAMARNSSKIDENGWTHLEDVLKKIGLSPGYYLADGSGLSPTNRISPESLVKALSWSRGQAFFSSFWASFPVSGQSGTMKNYCKEAEGKIRAKSGTLTRTYCYSGFAETANGNVVFSVMVNNYSGNFKEMKSQIEKILVGMTRTKI